MTTLTMWIIFGVLVLSVMILDLGVFHRKSHEVKIREAMIWTIIWVMLAFGFMIFIYQIKGKVLALEFLSAYLLEESLSVDNLFVFILIFTHFRVPPKYQHRILFWGIIGVLILRALFIGAGVVLFEKFHFMIYIFGVFLIYSGLKLAFKKEEEIDLEKNLVLRLCRRFIRVTNNFGGGQFFVREHGKLHATLLFIVLLIVETTDVVFAVDSVPVVLSVVTSKDPFIIYTSNVFAILGLRSLYFALAGLMDYFHFLNYGLCLILVFVGSKMLASTYVHVPVELSLGVIAGVLVISIIASIIWPQRHKPDHPPHEILVDK